MRPTKQLVESALIGDEQAIVLLVQRYEHTAVMAAWAIVGDFHLAQDVVQESFVAALKQLQRLRDSECFGPWFLTSVRRRANRARSRLPREHQGLELEELVANPECWTGRFRELLPMLSQLPEQELDVVSLRYISGMTTKQIATETGRSIGTVTKQLSRAIKRLQAIVAEVNQ